MWVDKEIGALLALEGYDENGGLSILLTTSEFVVDESIDQSVLMIYLICNNSNLA